MFVAFLCSLWMMTVGLAKSVRALPDTTSPRTLREIRWPIEAASRLRRDSPVSSTLTCDKDEPDIGDTFKLIVAAWCNNKGAVRKPKDLVITSGLTPWREHTHKVWVRIWTGNEYRLKDLGSADAKALSTIVIDAIEQIYDTLLSKAART